MSDAYPSPWPAEASCAVSVTFDDGAPEQLQLAVPRMTERNLFGTFYLPMGGENWRHRLRVWLPAQDAGHELGNHSFGHHCSENFQDQASPNGLESMTLDDMEADLTEAEQRIGALFGTRPRSFAYPCYMTHVGRGARHRSYVPLVAKYFIAGRGGGEYGFFNHPYHVDLAHVHAQTCQQMTAPHMIGLAERAARQGRWCILCFHGLSASRLGTPLNEFEELLDHLAAARERIWTAPVAVVAQTLVEKRREVGIG